MSDPVLWPLPFRGGTLEVWSDTDPGKLAIIAQLGLADPKIDAFYLQAGVELKDPTGKTVFPPPPASQPTPKPPVSAAAETQPEGGGNLEEGNSSFEVFDLFGQAEPK